MKNNNLNSGVAILFFTAVHRAQSKILISIHSNNSDPHVFNKFENHYFLFVTNN